MPACDTPAATHHGPVRPYKDGDRCTIHQPRRPGTPPPAVPVTTFTQPEAAFVLPPTGGLAASVVDTVKRSAARAPRSLQAAVGPSGLGTPCTRKLAYQVLDWPAKPNSDTDPWASVIGTATHAWMAGTYEAENRKLAGTPAHDRYLIEHRVHLPGGISGSCDLFDRDTGTVIDWKVVGPPRLKEYRSKGPGQQYRTQAHLYGLGIQLQGYQPLEQVAIVFLPRGGRVSDLHVWTEPYDPAVAVGALKRYEATREFLRLTDPEANPDHWALLPTADAHCTYCPFYLPGSADLSQGCPGHQATAPKEK